MLMPITRRMGAMDRNEVRSIVSKWITGIKALGIASSPTTPL
jgi:hypothetical protein